MEAVEKQKNKGYLYIFTAGILWGSIGIFVSLLKELGLDASVIGFLRLFIGWLLMIPLMFVMHGKEAFRIDRSSLFICVLMGFFSQAMFNFSYNVSIQYVGIATGCVLLYTAPVFVVFLSRLVLKEQLTGRKLAAIAINVLGCIMTVTGGSFSELQFSMIGVAAGVAAGLFYGMMTIFAQKISGKCLPLTITFYSFLVGWILMAIIARPWECVPLMEACALESENTVRMLLLIFGYGLIPTVGSYFFYMKGLSMDLVTSRVPVIASVETIAAALAGWLLFQEVMGPGKLLGIAAVFLSIVVMSGGDRETEE